MEYSNIFNFFLEHQIAVGYSEGTSKFFSRLDGELFFQMNYGKQLNNDEIRERCYTIYNTLKKENGKENN